MVKSLDAKLKRISEGRYSPEDFIIADAKDGDMAFGVKTAGPERDKDGNPTGRLKTRNDHVQQIREIVAQGIVDVMLHSASNFERLAGEGIFSASTVTPAIRGNDTTDIWNMRYSSYTAEASRPFQSANLDIARRLGCDICLYSMTFVNDLEADMRSLDAYGYFREEAAELGMRHFLEVFNPNVDPGIDPENIGGFVNDCIARSLAGLTSSERPSFLKIAYNGAAAMEELCHYDDSLVVGVMGGSAGTTRDTFELLKQSSSHGAKVALFGRKINLSESPLDIVRLMRAVVTGDVTPAEGVKAYHDALQKAGVVAFRDLDADLEVTEAVLKAEA